MAETFKKMLLKMSVYGAPLTVRCEFSGSSWLRFTLGADLESYLLGEVYVTRVLAAIANQMPDEMLDGYTTGMHFGNWDRIVAEGLSKYVHVMGVCNELFRYGTDPSRSTEPFALSASMRIHKSEEGRKECYSADLADLAEIKRTNSNQELLNELGGAAWYLEPYPVTEVEVTVL